VVTLAQTQLDVVKVSGSKQNIDQPGLQTLDLSNDQRFARLSDALKSVNGLQILDSGVPGDPVLVSIQGASSQQTHFLINGVSANSAQWGNYNLNELPIRLIERIEIYTSGNANNINYGIGGTINIITKDKAPSSILLGVGNFGAKRYGADHNINQQNRISFNYEYLENDYRLPIASPSSDPQNQFKREALNNADFERYSAQYNHTGDKINLELVASSEQKSIPDYFRNSPLNQSQLSSDTIHILLDHQSDSLLSINNTSSKWHLSLKQQRENFKDLIGNIGLSRNDDVYTQQTIETAWQPSINTNQWTGFFNITAQHEGFSSKHRLDDDSYTCETPQGNCDQSSTQLKLYNSLSSSWYSKNQSNSITVQGTHIYIDQKNAARNESNQENEDMSFFQGALVANHSRDYVQLNLSLERNVRIPALFERFGDRGLLLGSEDLQPEISNSITFEMPYQYQQFSSGMTLFYRDIQDAIIAVYDSRGVGRYENTSEAYVYGLEWKLRFDHNHFYYQISGSEYGSETTSQQVKSFNQKQLAGIYHRQINSTIGFNAQNWTGNLEFQYGDNLFLDRSNVAKGDTRKVVNAYIEHKWKQLVISASIQNLLDNQFRDYTNRPVINRQWFLNTTYKF